MALTRVDLSQPQPLFGSAATRHIEHAQQAALPAHTLMQRAGLATARLALALAPHARTIWIACGPGNNGGDGLEAALHLHEWGASVQVGWLGDAANCPADARAALDRAQAAGVPFDATVPAALTAGDLVIDGLLGIGAARPPDRRMREWLCVLRSTAATSLAIDLPSGLSVDTGNWSDGFAPDEAPKATPSGSATHGPRHTLSLLTLKPGLFTAQGRDAAGAVWFDDLGCSPGDEPLTASLNGAPESTDRPHASHKGTFGDVAVIGGAQGMAGALLLAGTAALFHGAGRVYLAPLDRAMTPLDTVHPELMFRSLQTLDFGSGAVVCGCGGGHAVQAALPGVLRHAARAVLDADALNAVAGDSALQDALTQRAARGQPTVLTPHPLEAARLLETDVKSVQHDRIAAAQRLADRFQAVVVLKGSGSVIAEPGRVSAINPTGNARLASAGTGDVLAGMIGARLAARHSAWEATCAAVYRHGQIADQWPADRPLTAGRLAQAA